MAVIKITHCSLLVKGRSLLLGNALSGILVEGQKQPSWNKI